MRFLRDRLLVWVYSETVLSNSYLLHIKRNREWRLSSPLLYTVHEMLIRTYIFKIMEIGVQVPPLMFERGKLLAERGKRKVGRRTATLPSPPPHRFWYLIIFSLIMTVILYYMHIFVSFPFFSLLIFPVLFLFCFTQVFLFVVNNFFTCEIRKNTQNTEKCKKN